MKKNLYLIALTIIGIITLTSLTQAGVYMNSTQGSLTEKDKSTEQKIYLEKDRVRIDMHAEKKDMSFIYRKDKETFWMINTADKSYFEMTKKDFEKMHAQMDGAMEKMKEQLKNLPPEQKEMMEKMLKGKMPGQAAQVEYKKIGSGEKLNTWICDKFEGVSEKEKSSEAWTTDFAKLNLEESDFQVFKDIGQFVGKFNKGQEAFFSFSGDRHGLTGIPVKVIFFKEGKPSQQTEIKEIKKQDLAANLFELPLGLKKKSSPGAIPGQ